MTPPLNESIFVTGSDSDKAIVILQHLLQLPRQHRRLQPCTIYAGLPDAGTARAKVIEEMGAKLVAFDIFQEPDQAQLALQGVSKLCLLIDPLSERMQRNDPVQFGYAFIDAAKQANVKHIVFLTPFSPVAAAATEERESYLAQFTLIELHLRSLFHRNQITILRYPGIMHQHLVVFRKFIAEHNAFPLPHLETTVELSNMVDIARAVARIAYSHTPRYGGNTYKITGPHLLTLSEVSERVLRGLRRENAVKHVDIETLLGILYDSLGNEDHATFLLEMWGLKQPRSRFEVTRDLEALTGQEGTTLKEYFEDDNVRETFLSIA